MKYWQISIATAFAIKKEINKYDKSVYGKITKPNRGVSEERLTEIETNINLKLHDKYKEFLQVMNGWSGFYKDVDILRVEEINNTSINEYGSRILESISDETFNNIGVERDKLFIVAYGVQTKNIFFISEGTSKKPGIIIWHRGSIQDVYKDFKEFFLSITKMNLERLNKLKEDEKKSLLV